MCSKFNHTQCGRTCACAVACFCPDNSISNVVVSVTTCIYIYTNIYRYRDMWTYTNMYVFVCFCICILICTSIWEYSMILKVFWVRQRVSGLERWWTLPERGTRWWRLVAILTFASFVMLGQKGDRPTEQSSSLFPSGQLKLNSFIREKRMIGGIGNVLLST